MEKEPIPIISLPASILAFMVIGSLYVLNKEEVLKYHNLYVGLGAAAILFGPFISQIVIAVWRIFFGFKSIDASRDLYSNKRLKAWWEHFCQPTKRQNLHDTFWHGCLWREINKGVDTKGILDYSRRRSTSAMTSSLAIVSLSIGFFGLIVYLVQTHAAYHQDRFIYFFVIWISLIIFFYRHLTVASNELKAIQRRFIKYNDANKLEKFLASKIKSIPNRVFIQETHPDKLHLTISVIIGLQDKGALGRINNLTASMLDWLSSSTVLRERPIYVYPDSTIHFSLIDFEQVKKAVSPTKEEINRFEKENTALIASTKSCVRGFTKKITDKQVEISGIYPSNKYDVKDPVPSIAFQATLSDKLLIWAKELEKETSSGKLKYYGRYRFPVNVIRFFEDPENIEPLLKTRIEEANKSLEKNPIKFTIKKISLVVSDNYLSINGSKKIADFKI
ncbi:MAG: hypothetical protein OEV37_00265 [Candidatus Berkelbacteria bacterium]|nr:hypothetical protein [Candidatus Berkelbacteria bacterium]